MIGDFRGEEGMNRTMRFRMGILVLMLLLGAGAAQALPEAAAASPAERWAANPLMELWGWVTSWLESVTAGQEGTGETPGAQTSREGDGGAYIDPNG